MIEKIIYYVGKLSLRMRRVSFKLRKSFCEWLNKEFGGKWGIGLFILFIYLWGFNIVYFNVIFIEVGLFLFFLLNYYKKIKLEMFWISICYNGRWGFKY